MSAVEVTASTDLDLEYLRADVMPKSVSEESAFAIVDLFAGCGGLTLGAIEGARRLGMQARLGLAIDHDPVPLSVLSGTLSDPNARFSTADLSEGLRQFGAGVSPSERELLDIGTDTCLLLAGPPCQGHSALNNHTRHDDARNDLYLKVARAARILEPTAVIVENVRGIGRDRREALLRCTAALEEIGYHVTAAKLDLSMIGVPQSRLRHVLVATQRSLFEWSLPEAPRRDMAWAIRDLLDVASSSVLDTPASPTAANRQRIDYLFDEGVHELPNSLRPVCHQSDHSYSSMYGRLHWDRPAQTITSGYGSMGQGRFVHPLRRRTLTPHEAARIQFLPDFLRLGDERRRTRLAEMIGNAVPPRLGIVLVEALVAQGLL